MPAMSGSATVAGRRSGFGHGSAIGPPTTDGIAHGRSSNARTWRDSQSATPHEPTAFRPAKRLATDPDEQWDDFYQRLVEFQQLFGHTLVPRKYEADPKLAAWVEKLNKVTPAAKDPTFEGHGSLSHHLVDAGAAFHQAMVSKALGNRWQTEAFWDDFKESWIKAATPDPSTE